MAPTSSTGGGGDVYAQDAVNSAAIHQNMANAAQAIALAASNLSVFSAETIKIKKDFQDIGSQAILDPEILSTSKEFEESALRIVNQYGKLNKHAGAILSLNKDIKKLEHDIATGKSKQTKESKSLLENMKKISKEYAKGTKNQKSHNSAWDKSVKAVQKYGGAVTGLNISVMGLIAMIVDVANIHRKINAYAKAGAAHLGDGAKAVYQTKSAMFDLRRGFATTYEEAGKVVGQLEAMGFTGEQISRKQPMLRSLKSEGNQLTQNIDYYERIASSIGDGNVEVKKGESAWDAANRVLEESGVNVEDLIDKSRQRNKLAKEITINNVKEAKAAKESVSVAQELYAIQRKYGIDIGRTGGIIKSLQQDFGASNKQARGLLGTAISLGTSLQAGGMRVGISDLLQDWGQLIEGTKVYKTDLLGILGLYNVMMKKDLAKNLGLGGVAKSVKMDIAKTLTSSALNMEFGWKARLGMRAGLGRSPAEAGIKFEKQLQKSPMEGFKTIVAEVTAMVGDVKKHPFVAEFKGRQLFQGLGFSKESSVELARSVAAGNLTEKSVEATIKQQLNEDKELRKLQRDWPKQRKALVASAGSIARGQQDFQAILKKWVEDKLMTPLLDILHILQATYAWFAGGSAETAVKYREFGESVGKSLGVPGIEGIKLASQSFPMFESEGLGPSKGYRSKSAHIGRLKELQKGALEAGAPKLAQDFGEKANKLEEERTTELFNDLLAKTKKRAMPGKWNSIVTAFRDHLYTEGTRGMIDVLKNNQTKVKVGGARLRQKKSGTGMPLAKPKD